MPASKGQSQRFLIILNIGHILVGFLSLASALGQFTPIGLDNGPFIDFRLLNVIHVVTGCVGAHMVSKNFGSVVAKSLYTLSLILAIWTIAFYSDTLVQESSRYESLREIRKKEGGEELINDQVIRNHGGKLALCSVMILISFFEAAFSGASLVVLDRLASDTYSNLKSIRSNQKPRSMREINRRRQMAFVALMKIFFSLATIVLGGYLESMYKRTTAFMEIGWQELTGAIVFTSACLDLHALYGRTHNLLNLKVSLVLSVASAVLSLKTLDYSMSNYFVLDVREYARFDELKSELQETASNGVQINTDGNKKDAFVKFVVHAAIVASLGLIFAHSVISAVEASSYIEWRGSSAAGRSGAPTISVSVLDSSRILGPAGLSSGANARYPISHTMRTDDESDDDVFEYDEALHKQKAYAGTLQCVWGLALIALCVISLVSWDFSRGYDSGAGVLWLGCLFIASGLVNAGRPSTFTTSVYVLSVVSLVLAFERGLFSLNVIYQAVKNPRFQGELEAIPSDLSKQRANYDAHVGRITLYSIEAGVLVLEFFTATWTAVKVTQSISAMPRPSFISADKSTLKGPLCSLGFFHLLYAFVTISVSVAAEIALWGYNVHVSYLVYMTNGIVVLAAVFAQWSATQKAQFLSCSAAMNIITASASFFVIAPAARDLYTLVASYRSLYEEKISPNNATPIDATRGSSNELLDKGKSIQEWIIGLNSLVLLLAIVEYVVSVVSGMISSYLLHHAHDPMTSDIRFSTLRSQPPPSHYWSPSRGEIQPPPSILTSKLGNGHNVGLSRGQSHSSLAAVSGVNVKIRTDNVPERYFGGTNDFRLYGRQSSHASNDRTYVQYASTSNVTASTAMRRTYANGHGASRHTGSVPSLLYGSSNGHANGHHNGHYHQYGTANGHTNGHGSNRANGFAQTSRQGFPHNASYMTTYT